MAQDHEGNRSPNVAVGDHSVLALLWRETDDEYMIPSLWLGTPES
jgi:hypothetical protein